MKKGLAKKVTSVLLASAMVFSLAACGSKKADTPASTAAPAAQDTKAEAKADDAKAPEAAEGKTLVSNLGRPACLSVIIGRRKLYIGRIQPVPLVHTGCAASCAASLGILSVL